MAEMTVDEFFAWRDTMRRKHRTMTLAEYQAWVRGGGDVLSTPVTTNPFPGGLTITFGLSAGYLGTLSEPTPMRR